MDAMNQPSDSPEAQVLFRLRGYLRCLGIQEEPLSSAIAQKILSQVAAGAPGTATTGAAIEYAAALKDQWYDAASGGGAGQTGPDPLVGWRLRRFFAEHARTVMEEPPSAALPAVAFQATPAEKPDEMPAQSLGEVLASFKISFLRGRLHGAWGRLFPRHA